MFNLLIFKDYQKYLIDVLKNIKIYTRLCLLMHFSLLIEQKHIFKTAADLIC